MTHTRLEDYNNYFIGDFSPTIIQTDKFEVGIKNYKAGEEHPAHRHLISTEVTVILAGRVTINGIEYIENDIITIYPGEVAKFVSVTDSSTLIIKTPSIPSDKHLVTTTSQINEHPFP